MESLLSKIERVPVTSLGFFPGNARRGNVGKIAESLRENDQYAPLVVQQSTRYVLAGNHTLKAARSLGWTEIDVVFVDVDDQRARKILLSANRTADLATDDTDALLELLSYLDEDYAGTGWTEEDVAALIEPPAPRDDDDGGNGKPDDEVRHYAVVLLCESETDQQATCSELKERGYLPVPARLGETVLRDAS
ncbi:MAG TPA: ParB N-terminal domain-containing protein [Streptosporangiaceae bacterium]|nr:ParB N-terminal domain-containing protein [Streptosporangiaceae bacterium]